MLVEARLFLLLAEISSVRAAQYANLAKVNKKGAGQEDTCCSMLKAAGVLYEQELGLKLPLNFARARISYFVVTSAVRGDALLI